MTGKMRADVALVAQHLCETRERARTAIMEGRVFLGERRINKASEMVEEYEILTVKSSEKEYVSRGALKLEKAIHSFHAEMKNKIIMDIGASTGGFTDVCLRYGAKHVFSIDVGYGQLDWKLRNNPKVTVMERTNARFLTPDMFPEKPSVTVMDVSFISIRLIIPAAQVIMGNEGIFYTLIKPQFEAGRENVGKSGVVRDSETHKAVLLNIIRFVDETGWRVTGLDYSPITGPKGNIEFLAEIQKEKPEFQAINAEYVHRIVEEAHQKMIHL